ncbi:hypothetical protein [Nocardia jinanensis]|uniref:Uncharacterized protein n=1 Tax=Nocardia jinanensis TaxID=382504 RepID=A0A917RST5_9NOCA|nr:hypothetical protein [Nocardia jinanensis]GGL25751.1 hypothetical protein GCM10011588_45670 [Nocardia jinanensis]
MPSTYSTPALLRGCVMGTTTGALAVAAHGAAGGGYPTSAGAALLLLTALVTGAAAGSIIGDTGRWAAPGRSILALLATGQFAGHWALTGLTGHHDTIGDTTADVLSSGTMTAAHLVAVAVCALAITAAERLYRSASTVVRALLEPPRLVPAAPRVRVATTGALAAHHSPNGSSGPRAPPARPTPDTPVPLGEKASNTCPTGSPPSCAGV